MAQVSVTIAGKVYRMACEDGQEQHLEGLAASFDQRISSMEQAFGSIGDMRLHVMASLMLVDELDEARKQLLDAEHDMRGLRQALNTAGLAGEQRAEQAEADAAQALINVSERIEALAQLLNPHTGSAAG